MDDPLGAAIMWAVLILGVLAGAAFMEWATAPELNITTIYKQQDRIASSSCTDTGAGN